VSEESSGLPTKLEGRLHPLALLTIARRFIGASLLPLVALLLSLGTKVLVPLLLAALLLGLPLAVLSWWRYRYRVAEGRLELRSGVLSRNVRRIPLDRIRGVDISAPFLHRLLGLVKVEVEAAAGGGSKAEISLAAVSRDQADALRAALLRTEPVGVGASGPALLQRTSPVLLALGGVTSMRYLLAPLAVLGLLLNLADDLPGGFIERAGETAVDLIPTDPLGIAGAVAGLTVVVLMIGAAGSLLVDWDFTLTDEAERFTASRGLLTRRVVTIDRDRIRGADVRDTPLRRPLGLVSITGIVAGLRGRTGGTTLAPVLPAREAHTLLRAVDPVAPDPAEPLSRHPLPARRRRLVRALALPLSALIAAIALRSPSAIAAAVALAVLAIPLALDRYRQLGHSFDGRRLVLRSGSLLRRWSEVDPAGVVAFELRSSPGQRRTGLCTLIVHLGEGAGPRRALDAGEDQAAVLLAGLHPRLFDALMLRPGAQVDGEVG
jgi:putative membrane protein